MRPLNHTWVSCKVVLQITQTYFVTLGSLFSLLSIWPPVTLWWTDCSVESTFLYWWYICTDRGLLHLVLGNPSDLLSQEHPVNHADTETTAGNLMIICKNIFTACTSEIKDTATRNAKRIETIWRGDTAKKEMETSVWLHPATKLWAATSCWSSDAAEWASLH